MAKYLLTDDGIFADGRLIARQQVEVRGYSNRDDQVYLEWPGSGRASQLGVIPKCLLKQTGAIDEFAMRCHAIGLDVVPGESRSFCDYIASQLQEFVAADLIST